MPRMIRSKRVSKNSLAAAAVVVVVIVKTLKLFPLHTSDTSGIIAMNSGYSELSASLS